MAELGQVVDGLRSAAGAVDVDPGMVRSAPPPWTPEGYETSALVDQPARAHVAVVSVGEDDPVYRIAPQEVIKGTDLVVVVGSREVSTP